MSSTGRVLLALAIGIAVGLLLNTANPALARPLVAVIEPIGTLFINTIRMTVIPLVVASLIVGVASASDARAIGRLTGRAVLLFLLLLIASGVTGALIAPPLLARVSLDPAATTALRHAASAGTAPGTAQQVQTPAQWLVSLVPPNPVGASANGAMLPLIVFAFALGLGLLVLGERRAPVVAVFRGVSDAMLVIVRWVLVLTPLGVFALALPIVARLGLSAVRALASYVVLVSLGTVAFALLVVYPAAALGGRMSLATFARGALPAQAVAFSSRSSVAALPAMIESAKTRLGLGEEITSFLLPLASAAFRVGAALGLTVGAIFIARLYSVTLSQVQIATVVATAVLTSFSVPGIPGGGIISMIPVLTSVGLPIEGLGILLGADTIPDSFRTTANVTGQMAAAVILAKPGREARPPTAASPRAAVGEGVAG